MLHAHFISEVGVVRHPEAALLGTPQKLPLLGCGTSDRKMRRYFMLMPFMPCGYDYKIRYGARVDNVLEPGH